MEEDTAAVGHRVVAAISIAALGLIIAVCTTTAIMATVPTVAAVTATTDKIDRRSNLFLSHTHGDRIRHLSTEIIVEEPITTVLTLQQTDTHLSIINKSNNNSNPSSDR